MTEVDVGLAGGVRHVLRHFGQSDARRMIYTARRITGPELFRMNVVSACVPGEALMGEAMALAEEIAAKSPARGAGRQARLHPDRGDAAARRLSLRAEPDRAALDPRRHQGGAARLRREAQARLQTLSGVPPPRASLLPTRRPRADGERHDQDQDHACGCGSASGPGGVTQAALKDRVVLLTGATSAIGCAIAERFVRSGAQVFATGSSQERLEQLSVATYAADLAEEFARHAMCEACLARFGRVDVVVHCAGTSTAMPLFRTDWAKWRREFAVNAEALMALAAWAIADMRKRRWGRIVAIGSVYASLGRNAVFYTGRDPPEAADGPWRNTSYAGSKGAIVNLVRDLAAAAGAHGITVNAVSPGMIDIPNRPISAERQALMQAATPLGRLGTPEEVAGAVLFLASEDASFITGVDLLVDGGWSAW